SVVLALITVDVGRRRRHDLTLGTAAIAGFLGVLAVVMFVAVGLSLSKMGLLAMLGSLFTMGIIAGFRIAGWRKWPLFVAMALLAILALIYLPPTTMVEKFGVLASDQPTELRVPIWKDSFHLIANFPVFGVGMGNLFPGLLRYQTSGLQF